jgi:hypothetical protein
MTLLATPVLNTFKSEIQQFLIKRKETRNKQNEKRKDILELLSCPTKLHLAKLIRIQFATKAKNTHKKLGLCFFCVASRIQC